MLSMMCVMIEALFNNLKMRVSLLILALLSGVFLPPYPSGYGTESIYTYSDHWEVGKKMTERREKSNAFEVKHKKSSK